MYFLMRNYFATIKKNGLFYISTLTSGPKVHLSEFSSNPDQAQGTVLAKITFQKVMRYNLLYSLKSNELCHLVTLWNKANCKTM